MLDWAIVGGGLHGTHISHVLTSLCGVPRSALRVIDPHAQPLAAWRRHTAATGMQYLRSPAAHNLGLSAHELLRYVETRGQFAGRYRRPRLEAFNNHCQLLIATHRLAQLRLTGRVQLIESVSGGYWLRGPGLDVQSRRVVLAPGQPPPNRPDWAQNAPKTRHVFAAGDLPAKGTVCVIGGGLSAAQVTLDRVVAGCRVTLVSRRQPTAAEFDSEPCYLGPKCLRAFHAATSPAVRRRMIRNARRPGSMPDAVRRRLDGASRDGTISWLRGEVTARDLHSVRLCDGRTLAADHVLLATGFAECPPAQTLVNQLSGRHGLALADDGFPLVDATLQWAPGLFLAGRLAELELGPVAGNIAGARLAGRRLAAYCMSHAGA